VFTLGRWTHSLEVRDFKTVPTEEIKKEKLLGTFNLNELNPCVNAVLREESVSGRYLVALRIGFHHIVKLKQPSIPPG